MKLGNLETNNNDLIIVTGHGVLAPTGVTMDEVFENQLAGKPGTRKVGPFDFSSINDLGKALKSDKEHPILKTGLIDDHKVNEAINLLMEMGGGLPSKINGAVSHNGKPLTDEGFKKIIEETLEGTDENYKNTIISSIGKGGYDPSIIHSVYTSLVAAKEAGILGKQGLINNNIPVSLGSGFAGLHKIERDGIINGIIIGNSKKMWLKHLLATLPNMPTPIVANVLRTNGSATLDDEACASAGYAYKNGIMQILNGETDIAIVGGCDAVSDSLYSLKAFGNMGALAKGYEEMPEKALRPFANPLEGCSKGFVLGDGGGISVIERKSIADARGTIGLAEIAGIGASTCNPLHEKGASLSSGTVEGQSISMNNALISAGISTEEFKKEGVIFSHGTGTNKGDTVESQSIHKVFGDGITVTGVKGVLGHSLGGSFGQSMSIGLSTFKNGIIPGTLNYSSDNKMDGIPDLDIVEENRNKEVKYIMINAFGFGGHNISMIIKNPKYF